MLDAVKLYELCGVVPTLGKAGWEVTWTLAEDFRLLQIGQAVGQEEREEGSLWEPRERPEVAWGWQLGLKLRLILGPGQGWHRRAFALATQ